MDYLYRGCNCTSAVYRYRSQDSECIHNPGCIIEGEVTNSVIFTGAKVRPGAKVIDSVLMPGAVVEDGAVVVRALVANGITVGKGALVGSADSEHIELIAKRVKGAE